MTFAINKKIIAAVFALYGGTALFARQDLTLSLAQCREMALAHNEDLRHADNELRQSELDKAIAFANYLPKFDASLSGTYVFPDMDMLGSELQVHGMYMAGITLTQPLYAGGKLRNGNKLAAIGRDCAEETLRKTRAEVIADADNAYWTYMAVQRKVRMLDEFRAQMDALHRDVEASVVAEMATGNDLLRITAKRSEILYQLQKARNGADLCRMALCNVIGEDLETQVELTDTLIAIKAPEGLDGDVSQRPEYKLLEKQIEAGELQVKMARADILPMVALMAGYTFYGNLKMKGMASDGMGGYIPYTQSFDDNFGMAMLSVSVPLFSWGQGLKKVKKARLDVEDYKLDLQKNMRLMSIEARQAMQNVTDGYAMVQTAGLGLEQAQENLRVMRANYENEMCTLTDLLDAQAQWQQAESNYIEAQTQFKIYETEYLRATGAL